MRRHTGILVVTVLLALAGAAPASGQDMSVLLPELRNLPAPAWVKEGLRLSYYAAAASVPQSYYYYTPDENGQWVSDDGQRWNRGDQPGGGGHGVTQVDVIALDAQAAVLNAVSWNYTNATGPLAPIPGGEARLVMLPGGGDWWVNPRALAHLAPVVSPGLKIVRMQQRLGAAVYDVVRIQSESNGARSARSYDLKSGLLVYSSSMTPGQGDRFTKGNLLLTETRFLGYRRLALPWAAAGLPDWLTAGKTLQFQGSLVTTVAGTGPVALGLAAEIAVTQRGRNYALVTKRTQLQGMAGMPAQTEQGEAASGLVHVGGLWVPPDALRALQVGQVLDVDEVTSSQVTVSGRGRDANGAEVLVLTAAARTTSAELRYDLTTGVLAGIRLTDRRSDICTMVTELVLTQVR